MVNHALGQTTQIFHGEVREILDDLIYPFFIRVCKDAYFHKRRLRCFLAKLQIKSML